ncbi:MAG: hypothetical protein ABIF85_07535 [Nanoarchaeota archaeon]|nr:hypothetical protein [Nanoarchaeota archaeon]MBU4300924.1 hypothetical protein [Nanoarchaeota archaeon]MBU4451531.1 hypothetical protein [Nanoarchaeota archaeon]MCG2723270.1 hypothetical protein [archaeon]
MDTEECRSINDIITDIKEHYFKGQPPELSIYRRNLRGSIYLSKDELDWLVKEKMIELLDFKGYQRLRLTEKGMNALNPEQSERYGRKS